MKEDAQGQYLHMFGRFVGFRKLINVLDSCKVEKSLTWLACVVQAKFPVSWWLAGLAHILELDEKCWSIRGLAVSHRMPFHFIKEGIKQESSLIDVRKRCS